MQILFVATDSPEQYEMIICDAGIEAALCHVSSLGCLEAYLNRQSWDVVILDSQLVKANPDKNIFKLLKNHHNRLPILLLCDSLEEDFLIRCLAEGATNFFLKKNKDRLSSILLGIQADLKDCQAVANSISMANCEFILRAFLEEASDVIWAKNLEGKYLVINSAGASFLGKAKEEIIGRDDTSLFAPDTAANIRATDLEVIKTGKPSVVEDLLKTQNGTKRTFVAMKTPFRDLEGSIQGIVGIIRDITERKEMEEALQQAKEVAEQANNRKNQFLASMSHELRTPLHTIISCSGNALEGIIGDISPKAKSYFSYVYKSSSHLLSIIDELLDLSKIEAGKLKLEIQEVPLNDFINQTVALVKPLMVQKGQILEINISDNVPYTFMADPLRLKQALCNLLSNAYKFTQPNKKITFNCYLKEQEYIAFSVTDEGPGIPEADIPRIVQPFEQGKNNNDSAIKGTGLGLPLVKRIAELHGGTLEIRSKVAQGSHFIITLPLSANFLIAANDDEDVSYTTLSP